MIDRVILNLRAQAWERAKGELNSMLHTYWNGDGKFKDFDAALKEFIEKVEDNELHT
jgi:hypothetical protein